jgi:AGCS family alanine or glycine:cation symporter
LYGKGWLFGVIMAILVGIVIIGGIKKIAKVTDKIVPFMVVIYVAASLFVLIAKYDMIGNAFAQIFNGAFSPEGVIGGAVGVLVQGFRRAAFSNEAGIGSASIAHSAVKTKYPASEGMVALLEPFIDTVVVCTMTALVLIITGNVVAENASLNDAQAILLTSSAFESVISWFPYVLTVAVVLFAFSTMISWSYYGFQGWAYLFGRTKKMEYTYKLLFCVFVVIVAEASLGSVIGFSDAMIFAMMVPNMIGLIILAPKVKEELNKYLKVIKDKKA